MRANRITATWRELESQPLVTVMFVLAVISVIARTALLAVPEVFPGGAALGEVIYDLAIAYVGAWAFNLLVVILPRLRDRERVFEGAGQVIERFCAVGLRMTSELGFMPSEFKDLADANQVGLFSLRLQDLLFTGESSLMTWGGDGFRLASWSEWTVRKALKAGDLHQSLIPYFPYFDSELIRLINKVALSSFVAQGRELAGVPVTGGNMSAVGRTLAEFITACRDLRTYYDTEVLMQEGPHDDNTVGEIATA
jgi:hypothetical protein